MAISDPTRREILELLNERGSAAAGEIAASFSHVSRPAISRHLRVLRECRLVHVTRLGKTQNYTLDPGPILDVQAWLKGFSGRQVRSLQNLRRRAERSSNR